MSMSMSKPKEYYECHITLEGDRRKIEHLVTSQLWKFSCIEGDPVMGRGVRCYATRHYNSKLPRESVLKELLAMSGWLETFPGIIEVTRRKIELVIFDDRSSKVTCIDNCAGCNI